MPFNNNKTFEKGYDYQMNKTFFDNIIILLIIAFCLIGFFICIDFFYSNNIPALITRLIPMGLIIIVLAIRIIKPANTKLITEAAHIFLASLPAMSYALIIIYHGADAYYENIYYAIVTIFFVSIVLHTNSTITFIYYLVPFFIFILVFLTYTDYTINSLKSIAGLPLILILGLTFNRMRYQLTYKFYITTVSLANEKDKTSRLNSKLNIKNNSLELQKKELENQNGILEDYSTSLESRTNQLALVNNDLKEANATKNRFFSIIAHDLKSPFNSLIGFSDILLTETDITKDEQHKYINIIHDSALKTYNLLENLLNWSMSQQNQLKFQESQFRINDIIDITCELYQEFLSKKNITIIKNYNNNLIVRADKEMLKTIFRNLINNAIKYSKQNSTITINTLPATYYDLEYAQISIEDNGVGISEDTIPKLFNIEENISSPGTSNETGTGLGLILCKEFITKNNGQIWIESEENKGSKFIFTIPI